MKKIFTLDALFVSLFSAAGYGFGYVIPDTLGAGALISVLCCFIAGAALGALGEKIVFSRFIQEKTSRRHAVFACVLSAFVLLNIISVRVLRHSLLEDYKSELVFGVVIPVAGFFFSILWYYIRHFRLKAKYGDGSSGFSLDRGSRAYIREQNTRNRELTGGYEKEFAVTLQSGTYVPAKNKDLLAYLGIPFAKPPVGPLRFKAPEKPEASGKIFEATHFGPSALQPDLQGNPLGDHMQSEDCLYLNVWTAAESVKRAAEAKKPVTVLFHGGDLRYGGAAHPLCSGERFVQEHPDTVFVSFN